MEFLKSKAKGELMNYLKKVYACEDFLSDFVVAKGSKKNKIWIMSKELIEFDYGKIKLDSAGLYFGREDSGKIRLSIEGAQIVGKSAKKNIVYLDEGELSKYIKGENVKPSEIIACEEGEYVLVKYKEDVVGCGKFKEGILINILPKSRKITKFN